MAKVESCRLLPGFCVDLPELTAQQWLFDLIGPLKWRALIVEYHVLAANHKRRCNVNPKLNTIKGSFLIIYTNVLNRGGKCVKSPVDIL